MKLDYDEIPNFSDADQLWDATKTWDSLINDCKQQSNVTYSQLLNALKLGIELIRQTLVSIINCLDCIVVRSAAI